jgi:hypothetical protein
MSAAKYETMMNEKAVNLYAQANTPVIPAPSKFSEPAARYNPLPVPKVATFRSEAFFNPERSVTTPMVPSVQTPVTPPASVPAPQMVHNNDPMDVSDRNPYIIRNWSEHYNRQNLANMYQGQVQANSQRFNQNAYQTTQRVPEKFDIREMHAYKMNVRDEGKGLPMSTFSALHESLESQRPK